MKVATPLAVLVSITIALIIVLQDWEKINLRSAIGLLLASLLGIPLGLILLTSGGEQIAKAILAIVIILFSLYSLIIKMPPELKRDNLPWLLSCGFWAGVFGGAYGMNGPPLVIYGTMRRWSAPKFRATLQGYFLPASLLAVIGYWHAGLLTSTVTHYYLISLPVMLPTIFLGRIVNHRLDGKTFFNYIFTGLLIIGVILLIEVI